MGEREGGSNRYLFLCLIGRIGVSVLGVGEGEWQGEGEFWGDPGRKWEKE